jgi:GNAT superfamily N-acetyltransferase|tara:strand:- start:237 stop:704 length:468 start_codon:yes stop_codon:yes gene_type:complete
MMQTKRITFNEVLPIWEHKLWVGRHSAIEPMSAMTWPFEGDPEPIDMSIFEFSPTFWGTYINKELVGVNSGHRTTSEQYRSRGIWVDPAHRGKGIAQTLFALLINQAIVEGCSMAWSIPRKSALTAYTNAGFVTVGNYIETETSDANIYAQKFLS